MSHLPLTSMATNKSKVLAYLPKQTYERLALFQRDRGVSLSQAVALVIEDYFGLSPEPLQESVSDRLTRLEDAIAKLTDLPSNSSHTDSPDEPINQSKNNLDINLLNNSPVRGDMPVQATSNATIASIPATPHSLAKQQVLAPSRGEWNVYLHHPRGTVEHIAGPFSDEEQAKSETTIQMNFGLFPESKGYQWECRKD